MLQKCALPRRIHLSCFYPEASSKHAPNNHLHKSSPAKFGSNARGGRLSITTPGKSKLNLDKDNSTRKIAGAQAGPRRPHHVLRLRDALFQEDSHDLLLRPKEELDAIFAMQGDAQNVAVWLRGRRSSLKSFDFNAMQARFEYLGGVSGPNNILQRLQSVAGNPAAVKQRLLLYDGAQDRYTHTPPECLSSFEGTSLALGKDSLPLEETWYGQRLKHQLLNVITGWRSGGIAQPGEQRSWCLYHFGPDLDTSAWKTYLKLLCQFGDSEVILSEWRLHREKHGTKLEALNHTIKSLIKLERFGLAWQLVYESGVVAETIQDDTWELLLAHPEFVKKWIPEMNGPALRMLEIEICKLEKSLGIRWEGGQEGFHVTEMPGRIWMTA